MPRHALASHMGQNWPEVLNCNYFKTYKTNLRKVETKPNIVKNMILKFHFGCIVCMPKFASLDPRYLCYMNLVVVTCVTMASSLRGLFPQQQQFC